MKKWTWPRLIYRLLFWWLWVSPILVQAAAYPVVVSDASGAALTFIREPARVVSLVPSATEMLLALGLRESVAALTYHDAALPGAGDKPIVGGFFSPSLKTVEAARPDLLIISPHHQSLERHFSAKGVSVLVFDTRRLIEAEENLRLLGRVFSREAEAEKIIAGNRDRMQLIREKMARIPQEKRKRVMRFMGRDEVMAPGDDSFQNELILAAGGVPPVWGKSGAIVPVTLEAWLRFNPQVLYGCGGDREVAQAFFSRPEWQEVEAVKKGTNPLFPLRPDLPGRHPYGGFYGQAGFNYLYQRICRSPP